jgi:aryl-alcohol dehydrogenase-like predicted oxidoreductase
MHPVKLPGTALTVSPLCLGGVPFGNTIDERATFALLDRWIELGGNFIDTARIYSDWVPGEKRRSERVLGDWLRDRGNRARVVLSTKGAHPFIESLDVPRTSAAELRDDLEGSLRTLRTEVVDFYWLHRDDPTRPVAHFIDTLNAFHREGKICAFGASNWTVARLRAANDYARASGQLGFAANQPFWCLGCQKAKPPPFTGYVLFDADAWRFHRETGLAVIPYTSQANGFFSKFALPKSQQPANLAAHDFHTPPNLAAAKIVARLATERNVAPSAIVLAYLWSRPFPVVPIVGSRTPAQLEDSAAALGVRLSTDELRALEEASQSGLPSAT